jgi:hypothetical protein
VAYTQYHKKPNTQTLALNNKITAKTNLTEQNEKSIKKALIKREKLIKPMSHTPAMWQISALIL